MSASSAQKREFYNKRARYDYDIPDSFEVGVALVGEEIKAIRAGRLDMTGSYAKIIGGEVYWVGGNFNLPETEGQRTRKLLLHKEEIRRLIGRVQEQGLTLIPLKLYLKRGRAKLELGLGRGKKKYDKRRTIKERDLEREARVRVKRS